MEHLEPVLDFLYRYPKEVVHYIKLFDDSPPEFAKLFIAMVISNVVRYLPAENHLREVHDFPEDDFNHNEYKLTTAQLEELLK